MFLTFVYSYSNVKISFSVGARFVSGRVSYEKRKDERKYIKLWALFACFSPVMAYLVTLTKRKGILAFVIDAGIFIGYIGINLLSGSFIKIYDIVFMGILIYLLFIKKYTEI